MRHQTILLIFFLISKSLFSQREMQSQCLERSLETTKDIIFTKRNGNIIIKGDTIHYDRSLVFLRESDPAAFLLFTEGILYPELILGASTSGDGKFKMSEIGFIGTISITSFHELKTTSSASPTTRSFSFLIWREGFANPLLYVLQLKNDKGKTSTSLKDFVKESRLVCFSFCSILI